MLYKTYGFQKRKQAKYTETARTNNMHYHTWKKTEKKCCVLPQRNYVAFNCIEISPGVQPAHRSEEGAEQGEDTVFQQRERGGKKPTTPTSPHQRYAQQKEKRLLGFSNERNAKRRKRENSGLATQNENPRYRTYKDALSRFPTRNIIGGALAKKRRLTGSSKPQHVWAALADVLIKNKTHTLVVSFLFFFRNSS